MDSSSKNYTNLDHYFFELTKIIPKDQNKFRRNIFQCNLDKSVQCSFIVTSKGFTELIRLFKHFEKAHNSHLVNLIIEFLIKHQINQIEISSIQYINDYIVKNILPIYEKEKQKIESKNIHTRKCEENVLEINQIDLSALNQTVLEQGIYEHLPLKTIYSKSHSTFISGFLKLGFELGRNSDISTNEFLRMCNNIKVSRNLLEKVGFDYFEATVSIFKGGVASFQIDASKINENEILVFIICSKIRSSSTFLFDICQNFQGDLTSYMDVVREKILKARKNDIEIVGLTTDNLPVQIQALSQESKKSNQNKYKDMKSIIHFRCSSHLLNLAYRDWMKTKNFLAIYVNKIQKIMKVLNNKQFSRKLFKKIPKTCITRWNSEFRALETLFHLRYDIIKLYEFPTQKNMKSLLKIKSDIKYIFTVGFLKVYPLLFHFASLVDYMQNENLSCVESVIIIEHFLGKMKENIIKYQIVDFGKDLYDSIKKRLILNKNVQLYQLASLMIPEGIIRYRQIMGKSNFEFNIKENNDSYFNIMKEHIILEMEENNRLISIDNYKNRDLKRFLNILNQFTSDTKCFKKSDLPNSSNSKLKQLRLNDFFETREIITISDVSSDDEVIEKKSEISENEEVIEKEVENEISDCEFFSEKKDHEKQKTCQKGCEENDTDELIENENKEDDCEIIIIEMFKEIEKESFDESINEDVDEDIIEDVDSLCEEEEEEEEEEELFGENLVSLNQINDENNKYNENNEYYENNENNENIDQEFFDKRKTVLEWRNIANMIINNSEYFNLTKEESIECTYELYDLLTMPFSIIQQNCPGAMSKRSKFSNFWTHLKSFQYSEDKTFSNLYKLATRLYVISATEVDAERTFSKIKWRFDDRRNRIKEPNMIRELYIENHQKKKIETNENFDITMWQHPEHKKKV